MGYFSELDLEMKEEYIDNSYASFEDQLLCRYEDLKRRCSELVRADAPYVGEEHFSKSDYRYAPISSFRTVTDVCRAMEVAKEDLAVKCGITVSEDGEIDREQKNERDPDQLTIFEVIYVPPLRFEHAMAS